MDTMRNRTLYIFFIAVTALFSLQSCSLEEIDAPVSGGAGQTYIEFIARQTSYNKTEVSTKASVSDIESAVHNAFLLVFDNSGRRILCEEITNLTTNPSASIPIDKGLSSVTACFLINVPSSFANGIKGLTKPTNDATALDNEYINTAVLSGISYGTGANFGLPFIDLDGPAEGSSPAVACIPMFGMETIDLSSTTPTAQITVKRLFAMVTMNIKMQLTNPGIGQIVPSTINYELIQYQLYNLPTKVSLVGCQCVDECKCESKWVSDKSAFYLNATTPLSSTNNLGLQTININDTDYNDDNNSDVVEGIEFSFYVPEYYLLPKTGATQDQKSKPENYDSRNKYAIYLELIGEVNRSTIDNTSIRHKIFLGGDAIDDFTLKRNTKYINQISIYGTDNNDYRVNTEIINNPVAQNGQSANCYVIGRTGKYTIPAYKGAYINLSGAPLCLTGKSYVETRVHVAFNQSETIGIDQISFDANPAYDAETNTISFSIAQLDLSILGSLDYVPNGNFVLELQYKESKEGPWITEWSWHFWCLNAVKIFDTGWGQVGDQKMPDGTTTMHDRNLGVVNGTPIGAQGGFYYKYGDHTPYLDTNNDKIYDKIGGGSLDISSWAPINGVKSPTDPCPPGYRVSSSDLWGTETKNYKDATKEHATIGVNSYAFKYYETDNGTQWILTDDYTIYYPYVGWFDSSFKPQTGVFDEGGDGQLYTKTIEVKYNYTSIGLTNYTSKVDTPSRFKNISWQRANESSEGRIWRNDGNALRYGYIYEGIKINSFEKNTGTWKSKYSTTINWSNEWTTVTDPSTLSDTEKTAIVKELDGNIFDKIDWGDLVGSLQKIFGSPDVIFEPVAGGSNGYQVRCVSENAPVQ